MSKITNPYHNKNLSVFEADNFIHSNNAIICSGDKITLTLQDHDIAQKIAQPRMKLEVTVRVVRATGPDWNEIPEGYNVFTVDSEGFGQAWDGRPSNLLGTFHCSIFKFVPVGQFPLSMYGIQYRPGYEPK